MKEIIYLDTNMINSALSQLDSGITENFGHERTDGSEDEVRYSDGSNTKKITETKGKFSGGIVGAETVGKYSKENSEGSESSKLVSEGHKEYLNRAFHDFSLNLLIEKLEKKGLLRDKLTECASGDFYLHEHNEFKFYNFETLKRITNLNVADAILSLDSYPLEKELSALSKQYPKKGNRPKEVTTQIEQLKALIRKENKKKEESLRGFELANTISEFGSNTFPNTTLFISSNTISLLNNEFMRLQNLSILPAHKRKHRILCRVHMKNEGTENSFQLPEQIDPGELLDAIPKFLTQSLLSSFRIIDVDDYFVTPFAIYYEE